VHEDSGNTVRTVFLHYSEELEQQLMNNLNLEPDYQGVIAGLESLFRSESMKREKVNEGRGGLLD
jgi:hypothetical protein